MESSSTWSYIKKSTKTTVSGFFHVVSAVYVPFFSIFLCGVEMFLFYRVTSLVMVWRLLTFERSRSLIWLYLQ